MDWNKWQAVAGGGRFPQGWNPGQNPQWTRPGTNNNNWGNVNQGNMPRQGQPMPGVHPDDDYRRNSIPNTNWNQRGPNNRPPPPQGSPPDWKDPDQQRRRNKNQRGRNKNIDLNTMQPPPPPPPGSSLMPMVNGGPMDGPPGSWGTSMGAVNGEEAQEISMNRQYGYAIMACAVVVLGVLMVSCMDVFKPTFLSLSFSSFVKMGSSPVRVFSGLRKKFRASSSSVLSFPL